MILSIIVPVYNEEKTIGQVLQKLVGLDLGEWEKEIIVVDDGSSDSSKKIIESRVKSQELRVFRHERNQGKGAAVKTGLKQVTGDAVIIQDADLEYNPEEFKKLLTEYDGKQVVYGSRNLEPHKRGYSHYVLGVKVLSSIVNIFYRTKLTDVYTCYKFFPAETIKKLNLESKGFEFEIEVTAKLLNQGVKIREVPISYHPRKFSEGKKIRAKDGVKGALVLLKNKF